MAKHQESYFRNSNIQSMCIHKFFWCFDIDVLLLPREVAPIQGSACWGKTASKCNHFCCTIYVYVCKCKQQCNAAGSSSSLLYDGWWVVSWSGWSNNSICDWSVVSNMALSLIENGHYVPKYSAHSAFRVLVIEHSQ